MIIQGTAITVTYKKIERIKKIYYENDSVLKEMFNEATVLPIPDNAPSEIPRIIIKTRNEHAQLNISPIAATFEVHYDSGFEKNWSACEQYISKRMAKVFEFLNFLTENKYEYIGVVTNVLYDEVTQNGVQKIAAHLLNAKKIKNLYDVWIKYTFVEEAKYYINIMLQNARLFKNGIDKDRAGELGQRNQIAESIGAIIDINDRYAFNTDSSYKSDSTAFEKILGYLDGIMGEKLNLLIEEGEY